MKLENVRALVTGGARGMGRTFVAELAQAGAKVAFCDVDADGVAQTAAELGVPGFVANVADEAAVEALLDNAWAALGGLNVLVNNAGITRDGMMLKQDKETGAVTTFPLSKWNEVLNVNLTGPFLCARGFSARCVREGVRPAAIVNLSSISRLGNAGQGNYSAAKAGLAADTVVWAKELSKWGIRVGAVAPGFIRTPMVAAMKPDALAKVEAGIPMKRLGEPEEIWQAVRFIVECEYFTGRVVEVDGGLIV
jgi:3-oxoacyl-[acyl-carrier protein] reductase